MNALLYGTGLQTQEEYLRFFDDVLPRNYEIGEYLRQHLQQEERVFIWGNAPDILARLNQVPPGRFIVAYHILGNSQRLAETATALRKDPPQYIVVLLRTYPFSLQQYRLETTIQHARIYKRK